jgi:hypothetical protein
MSAEVLSTSQSRQAVPKLSHGNANASFDFASSKQKRLQSLEIVPGCNAASVETRARAELARSYGVHHSIISRLVTKV